MNLRFGSVTWSMIGIAALAGLLAFEAARSAREHQAAAERVLMDYASLGAEGVATRLQGFLAGRLYSVLDRIRISRPRSREALLGGLGSGALALADSVLWAGRVGTTGPLRAVWFDSSSAADAVPADSIRAAARRLPDAAYFGLLPWGRQLVVFAPPRGEPAKVAAFALPLARVGAVLTEFLDADPVLPSSLTHGASLNAGVGVTLLMDSHRLAKRGAVDSTRFHAIHELGPIYGRMTVEVRLAEAIAPALVIGGLPGSRLPFLLGVMALALALAVMAGVQLRQRDRLAQLREDFVASASHELRTPLAQIRLFAETLRLKRVRSDDERTRGLTVIEREARRLEHLVENLLHFSRAERGILRPVPETADLGLLTREIVAEFAGLAAKAEVRIRVVAPASLVTRTDPGAWRQIVLNLLDNAVKYGGHGSAVTVGLERDAGWCRLSVSDEGPGVSPANRERVWERFWRGETAWSAGLAGTGIGLATVRDLVSLLGGQCWVEGNGSRGARFIVRVLGDA